MPQGKLIESKSPGSAVETRLITDAADSRLHFLYTQDCEPIIDGVKAAGEIYSRNQSGSGRYAGSIPLTVAQVWAQEWGVRLYSPEWTRLARKRLDDPDYRYLRVDYR